MMVTSTRRTRPHRYKSIDEHNGLLLSYDADMLPG